MNPAALLFDLDGTLTDSIDLIVHCYQKTVKEFLGQELTRDEVIPAIGCSLFALFAALSPDRWPQMVAEYRAEYARLADDWVTLYTEITDVFTLLESKNIPIGVVTSKGSDSALPALARFGLDERIAMLVTFEDTETHKPDPAPLLLAAERLELAPEICWYVGDSTHDLIAARAAGMRGLGALWGPTDREILRPLADDLLETPLDLGRLLV
jgi:pyrophosphatase PpaX